MKLWAYYYPNRIKVENLNFTYDMKFSSLVYLLSLWMKLIVSFESLKFHVNLFSNMLSGFQILDVLEHQAWTELVIHRKYTFLHFKSWNRYFKCILLFFSSECTNKGGVSSGSCANGFGVCCTCRHHFEYTKMQNRNYTVE